MRHTKALSLGVTAALSGVLLASCGLPAESVPTLVRAEDGTVLVISDPEINESSGLAASIVHPGVFYTHNDKGSAPQVYAVAEDGTTKALLELEGAPSADWEDIAVTPDGNVWVADIGGVKVGRSVVSLVRFAEPAQLTDGAAPWTSYRLAYEDGAHDAEALLVDPQDGRVYVVTKDPLGGGLYAAPPRLRQDGTNTLRRIGDAPANITGGSFSSDGERFALRNYRLAFVYTGVDDQEPVEVEIPRSPKGESVVLLRNELLLGSEGASSEVHRVRVPREPTG
jgi:hypothetical protein